MKRVQKFTAVMVAALMLVSCFALGASAALTAPQILEQYGAPEKLSFYQDFSNVTDISSLGAFDSTADMSAVIEDGVLKLTDGSGEKNAELKYTLKVDSSYIYNTAAYVVLEFDVKYDHTAGQCYIRIMDGGSDKVRLGFAVGGRIYARSGNSETYFGSYGTDGNGFHTIKLILDKANSKYYLYSNGRCVIPDGFDFYSSMSGNPTGIKFLVGDAENAAGSIYVDNVKVYGLYTNASPTPKATEYLYNEDFEAYDLKGSDEVVISSFAPYETGNESVLNDKTSGSDGSSKQDIFIVNDPERGNVAKITNDGRNEPHCWYFEGGIPAEKGYVKGSAGNYVIQYSFKTSGGFHGSIGFNGYKTAKLDFFTGNEDFPGGVVTNLKLTNSKWHDITLLIKRDGDSSTKETVSVWLDGLKVADNVSSDDPMENNLFICFRYGNPVYVDDIRFFQVDESFYKLEKLMDEINEIEDIAYIGEDGNITGLRSAEAVNALVEGDGVCEIAFSSDEPLIKENEIEFSMTAGDANITVEITAGANVWSKTFENVVIPAAYSFSAVTPATSFEAAANCTVGTVTGFVRNAASDKAGRIKVITAIYDKTTKEMLKVEIQSDVLGEGNTHEYTMDLSEIAPEKLQNAEAKLFIWTNSGIIPMI